MLIRIKKLFTIKGYCLFMVCMLLVGTGISITMPYLSLYSTEELGMSAGAFGVFMAVSSLSGVLINSFIAKRSDSGLNRKLVIIIAMLSSALGYVSYLLFHNYFLLLLVVTVFNGLGAAAMPQIFAFAQESANASKSDDKTFALSTLRSLVSLGFLIGPLGGTIILGLAGYKGLFLGTSVIFLIIASLVFFFLSNQRNTVYTKRHNKLPVPASSLKNKQIRYPFIAFILLFAVNAINVINTPLFIVNELHGSHAVVGIVVSVCAGLEIPIMIGLGALGKKISNHSLMIISCFIAGAYYIILATASHSWILIAAQLLQAVFVAIVMGNGLSYFTELLPSSPGISATIYSNGSTIGRLVGNLGGGFIATYIGFRFVNLVCLLLVLLSFFILWKARFHKQSEVTLEESNSVS
ncbi:sugar efflux transporter [Bacillus sp. Au-Bac7]|uniref:sugar efflux transporter n=1 Tax=Bacillus sp. Au-Bac7 TaxID=2906458 RepID=UPI001E2F1BBA|nr:sugar efflux transporter [Bacillus sp. Au-Bac7]MCE4051499.1 sugar efflux transporter [Bacillus sp. Au-Bac7]